MNISQPKLRSQKFDDDDDDNNNNKKKKNKNRNTEKLVVYKPRHCAGHFIKDNTLRFMEKKEKL